ncbi:P-loop containing nucleoside triphosphate hydrolase [Trema orientale]|uniref:P-loop containing nucleoside triphosphate hydrolase n=1 Tax=Trema orientale TaxID=63057 RepID=A0A2P5CR39_TREOI|nr:P-loop containing nucleoside triphosphate hydrolase [Trema orientale]
MDSQNEASSSRLMMSLKTSALLKVLVASRNQNSAATSVVFSQFEEMLIILEKPLKEAVFKTLCLDGSIDVNKRTKVINEFGVSEKRWAHSSLAWECQGFGDRHKNLQLLLEFTSLSHVGTLQLKNRPRTESTELDRKKRLRL